LALGIVMAKRAQGPRIRRLGAVGWGAELDLDVQVVMVFKTEDGWAADEIGCGRWVPLPPPLDRFRGRVVSEEIDDDTCDTLERLLSRGTRAWSFGHGPWADAEREAIAAGVGEYDARLLRKLMWSFYRGRGRSSSPTDAASVPRASRR